MAFLRLIQAPVPLLLGCIAVIFEKQLLVHSTLFCKNYLKRLQGETGCSIFAKEIVRGWFKKYPTLSFTSKKMPRR